MEKKAINPAAPIYRHVAEVGYISLVASAYGDANFKESYSRGINPNIYLRLPRCFVGILKHFRLGLAL